MSAQCHFQALILRAARVIIIIATSISVCKSNFQCGVANFCDDLMPGLIDENCAGIFLYAAIDLMVEASKIDCFTVQMGHYG